MHIVRCQFYQRHRWFRIMRYRKTMKNSRNWYAWMRA